jgi:CRISPR/Cas system Type II protein with McrA/HNH and RuvC-like nuclease domain
LSNAPTLERKVKLVLPRSCGESSASARRADEGRRRRRRRRRRRVQYLVHGAAARVPAREHDVLALHHGQVTLLERILVSADHHLL